MGHLPGKPQRQHTCTAAITNWQLGNAPRATCYPTVHPFPVLLVSIYARATARTNAHRGLRDHASCQIRALACSSRKRFPTCLAVAWMVRRPMATVRKRFLLSTACAMQASMNNLGRATGQQSKPDLKNNPFSDMDIQSRRHLVNMLPS